MHVIETVDVEWTYEDYREPLSVHVVEGAGATVLVGGGDPSIAEAVLAVARDHDVDVVLIEHAHVDHYGAVPAIREAMDVEVAIPEGDTGALRAAGIEPDHLLMAGETYWGIETIAAPGHTPGNMSYLVEGVLLAGDTVVGSDSQFAASDAWSGPLAVIEGRFNDDDALARESVSVLRKYDFEAVRLSHGSHVESGGGEAIETLLTDLS